MSRPPPLPNPSTDAFPMSIGQTFSPTPLSQPERDLQNTSSLSPPSPSQRSNNPPNRRRCPLRILIPPPAVDDPSTYTRLHIDNHISGETAWDFEEMMILRSHAVPPPKFEEEENEKGKQTQPPRQQNYYDDGRMRVREIALETSAVTTALRPVVVRGSGGGSVSELILDHIQGYVEIAGRGRGSWKVGNDNEKISDAKSGDGSGSNEPSTSPPPASSSSPSGSQQQGSSEESRNISTVGIRNNKKLKKAKEEMRDKYPGLKENKGDVAGRWMRGSVKMWAAERWLEVCEEEGAVGYPEMDGERRRG